MVVQLERPEVAAPAQATPRARRRPSTAWLVVLVGVLLAAGGAWVLRGSPFPPNGYGGDEGFRLASVARDARHLLPVDFAYRGLPAFYPPMYFFVLGRVVAATGMSPYEALKFGTLAVAFLVPIVGYALWRRVTGQIVLALGVVIAALAVTDWFEPYAWLATIVFVPWWLGFVVRVGDDDRPLTRRSTVVGALVGGALLMTYYYPFFIGVVQLLGVLVVGRIARSRGLSFPLRITRQSWCVLAGAALVSAVYWVPIAVTAVTTARFESLQNRYFDGWMSRFPLPFLEVSVSGAVMLIGLVSIVVGCRRSKVLLGLASLLIAGYAWFVVGYAMVLLDTPVLAFRAVYVIEGVLAAGAGIGVGSLAQTWLVRRRPADRAVPLAVCVVIAVAFVGFAVSEIPFVAEQRSARVPSALLRTYDRATTGRAEGDVVLTGDAEVSMFRPVYLFNAWNAHYSNPLSEFRARSRFLDRLAHEPDPAVVAAALRHNRYDVVDVLVLRVEGDTLTYTDYQDNFPRGTRGRTLTFSTRQFGDRWFRLRRGAGRAVLVARPGDPLPRLTRTQDQELRGHFAGDLTRPD